MPSKKLNSDRSKRLLSVSACRRILAAAGGRRFGGDLNEKIKSSIYPDPFGIVHKIFRDNMDELSQKAMTIMVGENKSTLLPRHVKQLGMILGDLDPRTSKHALPKITLAPIHRRLKRKMVPPHSGKKPARFTKEAVELLVYISMSRTVAHLRSGVGLSIVAKRSTVYRSDVENAAHICNEFPR